MATMHLFVSPGSSLGSQYTSSAATVVYINSYVKELVSNSTFPNDHRLSSIYLLLYNENIFFASILLTMT